MRETRSDVPFDEESDYSKENAATMKTSAPFFNHFSLSLNRKKRVVMTRTINMFKL